ncbi:transglycosylase SLT domain-containing protein [Streptomyces aidingensis]|uniref:Transglycosylase SLT domain-containing protein n=1 Tax=Streptomyces aidingensis TaxID=910347 RepID=A0A1I1LY22_9ACTN|nr:transglycosylase SLT domain-containing protein [Streptomyces aidingensis]SFC77994.1 Transglycosylase SLT domain-containing protein [Streptomyces aidingensis]
MPDSNTSTRARIVRTRRALAAGAVAVAAAGVGVLGLADNASAATAESTNKDIAREVVDDAAQFACFDKIVEHESGWDHTATNPSSGAYGLVQALPASKMDSAGSDWRTNPETQIEWGLDYMNERYGSPCEAWDFWQANNWY